MSILQRKSLQTIQRNPSEKTGIPLVSARFSSVTNLLRISEKDEVAAMNDEIYIIEALLEKRGYKYLVKWENYPEPYNSWEPRFSLPKCIVEVNQSIIIF